MIPKHSSFQRFMILPETGVPRKHETTYFKKIIYSDALHVIYYYIFWMNFILKVIINLYIILQVVSDSDDDSLFGGDNADDDSSSSSESEDDGRRELKGRARWLKKAPTATDNKKKEEVVKKDRVIIQKKKEYADPAAAKRAANAYVEVKLSEEELDRKLSELLALRGKRTTDARESLRQLEVLTKASRLHGPRKEIPVLMHLISNMLDSQRSIDDYLEHHQWRTCYRSLYRVVSLMETNKKLTFASHSSDDAADLGVAAHLKAAAVEEEVVPTDPNVLKVAGSIASYIVRLQDEYTKSLQQINPHTKVRKLF